MTPFRLVLTHFLALASGALIVGTVWYATTIVNAPIDTAPAEAEHASIPASAPAASAEKPAAQVATVTANKTPPAIAHSPAPAATPAQAKTVETAKFETKPGGDFPDSNATPSTSFVRGKYSEFDDATDITVMLDTTSEFPDHFLAFTIKASGDAMAVGREPDWFTIYAKSGPYHGCSQVQFMAAGEIYSAEKLGYSDEIWRLRAEDLKKICKAKSVKCRLGLSEFEMSEATIDAMRDFASRLNPKSRWRKVKATER